MEKQRVQKVGHTKVVSMRPFYTTLIIMYFSTSLFVVFDNVDKNHQIKEFNKQIEKQIKKNEELQILSEEIYKQYIENNDQLNETIIRVNLRLDQLNHP